MFTKEDISSLPLHVRTFQGDESNQFGQLFVAPETISKKIKMMKENKSPRVVGIPPQLLKEIVDQICTPLAIFFNLSLKEGFVPW